MVCLWTVLFLVLAGCGESGSSGFDVVAGSGSSGFDREQLVIARVSGVDAPCEPLEGTTFCGPNDPLLPSDDGKNPFSMDVEPQSGSSVPCVIQSGSDVCGLGVILTPVKGFQSDVAFILAVRSKGSVSLDWEVASSSSVASISDLKKITATAQIRGLSPGATRNVDLAVLAYTSTTATLPLSGTVNALLSDFKSDVAFVVTDVTVTRNIP
jgi:hypothetical protein